MEVAKYQACRDRCQMVKFVILQNVHNILHSIPVLKKWSQIDIGITCPFISVDCYCYVVTTVDYFSKYVMAVPIHQKSAVVVDNFLSILTCLYGCSHKHGSDQSRKFLNKVQG